MTVRTRIAPAPSGYLHVGNARTALYNWLFARHNGGTFVLRVEDTDVKRVTEESFAAVLDDLRWLGLSWDEGPGVGGPHAPYRQSQRFERYDHVVDSLLGAGHVYRCYCTPEELAQRRERAQAEKRPPGYDGRCRSLTDAQRRAFEAEGRAFTIRFKVPEGRTIAFDDVVRGRVSIATAQISDFVLRRADGSPVYQLAATVDDVEMRITHVIRGEDLLAATPRQLLLREAMGVAEVPVFAHLPLLVDPSGRPLSKRWDDVAVAAYRAGGFLPEAMVNYLALLGWSYDDRTNVFSVDELVERFTLERVGRNPAAFDVGKLEWLNGHYIRAMTPDRLAEELVAFCESAGLSVGDDAGRTTLAAVAPLLVERLKRLTDAPPMVRFLFETPEPDAKAAKALDGQRDYLAAAAETLQGLHGWSVEAIEAALRALAGERGLKPKQAFQPIRAAVTGTLVSPPLFESLEILGRDRTLDRLRRAAA